MSITLTEQRLNEQRLNEQRLNEQRLNDTFAALAHETRRAILARLANSDATVNELAEPFAMSLPAISRHIKVLERAGLIVRSRQAQYRPCSLDPAQLSAASTWAQECREVWESSFDRLDDYLTQLQDCTPTNETEEGTTNV